MRQRRAKERAGDGRRIAPAMPERERRRSVRDRAVVARRGAPAYLNRDRWRSALRRRYPPPCTGSILRLSPALSPPCASTHPALCLRSPPRCTGAIAHAVLPLSAALHWRSPPRYASARLCTATALYIGLGGPSMQVPALFPSLHSSFPSFAGALPYAMPALGHAKAARGRSSPLTFNTTCGGAALWGASWWGRLRCLLPQSHIYLV